MTHLSSRAHYVLLLCVMVAVLTAPTKAKAQDCCYIPQGETDHVGPSLVQLANGATVQGFFMGVNNNLGTYFNGRLTEEGPGNQGSNTCWWNGAANNLDPQHPAVSGGTWTVGSLIVWGGTVVQSNVYNTYGYDYVGVTTTAVDYVRTNGPGNHIALPCTYTIYQIMYISCPDEQDTPDYAYNTHTDTIYAKQVVNCRISNDDVCETTNYVTP
jgi:hypothetical protein